MTLLLLTLASYRLWRLLAMDTLPVIDGPRDRLWQRVADRWGVEWAEGLTCAWCSGTWITAAVTAVVDVTVGMATPVLQGAAAAAGVGLIAKIEDL